MGRGVPKEIKALLKRAEHAGAIVTQGRSGHFKVTGTGWVVMVSQTPKNVEHCVEAARRDMRKRGLDV